MPSNGEQNFPSMTLKTLDDAPFSFSDLAGKRYLVFMWASW